MNITAFFTTQFPMTAGELALWLICGFLMIAEASTRLSKWWRNRRDGGRP